jgi:hypothetical protein
MVLFFVAASASFSGFYTKWRFRDGFPDANVLFSFDRMVDGTAIRPYVYRQLIPDVANWISKETPATLNNRLTEYCQSKMTRGEGSYSRININPAYINKVYLLRYLVVYVTTFLITLLSVCTMHLVCKEMNASPATAVLAPVCVILMIPYLESVGGYFYDFPELAFMMLAVWIALRFDWWWIAPLAVLGTWNKESYLLFIPTLYPFFRRRTSRLGALAGTVVLSMICVGIYYFMRMRFANNPGGTVEIRWSDNLAYYTHLSYLLYRGSSGQFEMTFGLLLPPAGTLLPMAFIVWTVWRAWRYLPSAMQHHGQIAAVINIPLYLLFCAPGELRDLSMLYVIVLATLAANLNELFGNSTDLAGGSCHLGGNASQPYNERYVGPLESR